MTQPDDYVENIPICSLCKNIGIEGGCPECGFMPLPPDKVIDGITYHFYTNTDKDDAFHNEYKEMQRTGELNVIFEPAVDHTNNPRPDLIAIWIEKDC